MATNPSVDGTLAAVEAPSRNRVNPRRGRLPTSTGIAITIEPGRRISAVIAVSRTATSPKTGPICMTR